MNPGYGLGIGIICAPLISAVFLALGWAWRALGLHHTVRALYRYARTRSIR